MRELFRKHVHLGVEDDFLRASEEGWIDELDAIKWNRYLFPNQSFHNAWYRQLGYFIL